jgi:uncharacterized membrane protein YphA (DoxX/SURF4 family)
VATLIQQPARTRTESSTKSFMPYALWTAQVLLAVTFLFAGSMKFIMSGEDLTKDINLPVLFLRFIGVCEVLGAIGMIAPGLLHIRRGLTPLAAMGLVIIMVGATVITVAVMGIVAALFPLAVGIVASFVAYSRRSWFSEAWTYGG